MLKVKDIASWSKMVWFQNHANAHYAVSVRCHKNLKVRVRGSRSEVTGANKYTSAHLPLMCNVPTKFGDRSPNTLDTAGAIRF